MRMATTMGVREKPILFSGPMVRAILDGRKTMTRRIVKPKPIYRDDVVDPKGITSNGWWWTKSNGSGIHSQPTEAAAMSMLSDSPYFCPHGKPGDWLWVRETWAKPEPGVMSRDHDGSPIYAADFPKFTLTGFGPWKPSIFMPRWYSRITLEITGVKVERLTSITEDDAMAEGCGDWMASEDGMAGWHQGHPAPRGYSYRNRFKNLWDSINGKREGCSWADNPWVWAITFERIQA